MLAAHGDKFAVDDEVFGKFAGGVGDFDEGVGDFFEVARINGDGVADFVKLGADAVVFVFDPDCRWSDGDFEAEGTSFFAGFAAVEPFENAAPDVSGGGFRRGEHVFDGAKGNEGNGGELAGAGEGGGFADVAEEEVGSFDFVEADVEGLGDGVFDKTFF